MACAGVRWVSPPKGIRTLPAPMVPSNRSVRPRRLAHLRLDAMARRSEAPSCWKGERAFRSASATRRAACFTAPLVFRKSRLKSAIFRPFQCITIRGLSVTVATW